MKYRIEISETSSTDDTFSLFRLTVVLDENNPLEAMVFEDLNSDEVDALLPVLAYHTPKFTMLPQYEADALDSYFQEET